MNDQLKGSTPIWVFPKSDPKFEGEIVETFFGHDKAGISKIVAQTLVTRRFDSIEKISQFISAGIADLHDPYLFRDMDRAVKRVIHAIEHDETILIYGDNDVDGITATAALAHFFQDINAKFDFYIPNRNTLKQSLIRNAVDYAEKNKCKLIITVDCGITAKAEIEEAFERNIDVIVTDHHEPTDALPKCVATLNPKLLNSTYPNRELTGVGVAFKLILALYDVLLGKGMIQQDQVDRKNYLDLVALGTVADMGSLTGENRILVRAGIDQMKTLSRVGLRKLIEVSDVNKNNLSPIEIASKIAPRINSLGRIDVPRKGVHLLLLQDKKEAEELAKELDLNNQERQSIEKRDSEGVDNYIQEHPEILDHRAIVLHSDEWHPGIIPIITARIAKQYNRPTLIIAIEDGIGKGSMRTIPKFPLLPVLKENGELLINFGGHDYAAGMSISDENIEPFKEKFIEAADASLEDNDVISKLEIDAKVSLSQVTPDLIKAFSAIEPFGNDNPPPVFYCDVEQSRPPRPFGKGGGAGKGPSKKHLKMNVAQDGVSIEAIGFNMGERINEVQIKTDRNTGKVTNKRLSIAFTPQMSVHSGHVQLLIRDFRVLDN